MIELPIAAIKTVPIMTNYSPTNLQQYMTTREKGKDRINFYIFTIPCGILRLGV